MAYLRENDSVAFQSTEKRRSFKVTVHTHLNTCCSDAYESDSGVSSLPFAKQNFA